MNKSAIFFVIIMCSLSACKKESVTFSEVPSIEFRSLSTNQIQEFESVTIVIFYNDGDGDLGENEAGKKNLFITDNRNQVVFQRRIPQLAPSNANVSIQGELSIVMDAINITDDNATNETLTYSIYLTDRSGNQSNVITTNSITVQR